MTQNRQKWITLGILLSLFMASVEGTIVATAMPTIVSQLGGLSIYSWVFSIYMLTSTTTVPLYGKLSDIFGRKPLFAVSMLLFLAGSLLCGLATNMEQLILFRAVQGIGAGGMLPLTFIIIGDLFNFQQRARMQGMFSGVWGISSIIGPLIGGFLVDQISWRWVFLINLLPGLIALFLVWLPWHEIVRAKHERPAIDYAGAGLLTFGALSLLLGLQNLDSLTSIWFISAALLMFLGLAWVERRAPDPILPLPLFKDRLFTIAILHGILAGWAMFGSLNYVPLFVQAVLGTSATIAGFALTPMSLAWTFASMLTGQLLLRTSYRVLTLVGMALLAVGALCMTWVNSSSNYWLITGFLSLMGVGMGLTIPSFLIAVQSSVRRSDLGAATSTIQFSRSIGGTLGVSILGVVLSSHFISELRASGLDPSTTSLNSLLDSVSSAATSMTGPVRDALAIAIANVFMTAFLVSVLAFVVVLFTPSGKIAQLEENRAGD